MRNSPVQPALLAAALAAILPLPHLVADESGTPPPAAAEDLLQRMSDRIEALEARNATLEREMGDLRRENGDRWLTEERANQIRALVGDVLADADARASLQSSGMTAGWDNGFFLSSPDGRFRLELEGQLQVRYVMNWREKQSALDPTDTWIGGFENTRTRLTFRGHVFDRAHTYLVRGNFSRFGGGQPEQSGEQRGGEFKLLDAWIRTQLDERWAIRVGQFKLPFAREELVSSAYQQAIERSLVNESLSVGRSQGIEAQYQGDFLAWRLAFSDGGYDNMLGVGSLAGTQPPNTPWSVRDTEYAFTSRLEWLVTGSWEEFEQMTSPPGSPYGVLVGAAAHYQRGESGQVNRESRWLDTTADISFNFGGANIFASANYTYVDTATFGIFEVFGAVLQGGVYVAPNLELFARFEWGTIDSKRGIVDPTDLSVVTAGVNWYIDGQDLKLSFDVGFGIDDVASFWAFDIAGWRADGIDTRPQFVIRTQFQLLF